MATFVSQMKTANPQFTSLILVPKIRLVEQISKTLTTLQTKHGIYCGSMNKYDLQDITVATYQSVMQIQNNGQYHFDTIILDEAHRLDPSSSSAQMQLIKNFSHADTRTIGFTATPYRGVRPLWKIGNFWPEPCSRTTINELTKANYLVKAKMVEGANAFSTKDFKISQGDWAPEDLSTIAKDHDKLSAQVKDAISHLNKHNRQKVVWLCINQDHAETTTKELLSLKEEAVTVISRDSFDERDDSFEAFEKGTARHLVSVNIASEGFDYKPTDAVVFLRPTRSVVMYIQAVGRALRVSPETKKEYALILDYGEVVRNCGKLDRPFISEDGTINTDTKKTRESLASEAPYRVLQCKHCGCFFFPARGEEAFCSECGEAAINTSIEKLSKEAASGELYGETTEDAQHSQYIVVGYEGASIKGDTLHFTLKLEKTNNYFLGAIINHPVELYAPKSNYGQLSKYDMGRLKRTKAILRDYFQLPQDTARKMAEALASNQATVMPRTMAHFDSHKDFKAQSHQPMASKVNFSDVLQESLF